MNQELTKQLAAAVVSAYRNLTDAPSEGKRRLFNAVNEAWAAAATGFPPPLASLPSVFDRERQKAGK